MHSRRAHFSGGGRGQSLLSREGFEQVKVSTIAEQITFPSLLDYVRFIWLQRRSPVCCAIEVQTNAKPSLWRLPPILHRFLTPNCCAMEACCSLKNRTSQ